MGAVPGEVRLGGPVGGFSGFRGVSFGDKEVVTSMASCFLATYSFFLQVSCWIDVPATLLNLEGDSLYEFWTQL